MISERDDVQICYEVHGEGSPILLFAPGGMRSTASFWRGSAWDPIDALSGEFQVIALGQRNAAASVAPASGSNTWSTYTSDNVALADHLGRKRLHHMGGCIGKRIALVLSKLLQNESVPQSSNNLWLSTTIRTYFSIYSILGQRLLRLLIQKPRKRIECSFDLISSRRTFSTSSIANSSTTAIHLFGSL